jgi:ferredoxin-like protein FixX
VEVKKMTEFKIDVKKLVFHKEGDTGDFIAYDKEKCDGCGMCVLVCAANLWTVKDGKAKLTPRYGKRCMECAACWDICEREAINFSYPSGGSGIMIKYG